MTPGPAYKNRQNLLQLGVDFNGVIHDHDPGKLVCDASSREVPGAIDWLQVVSEEYNVFLVSASFGRSEAIGAAKEWLQSKGIPPQWLMPAVTGSSRINFTPFKPKCVMFIDDRAWAFRGTFPSSLQIQTFKPWNR